MNIRQTRLFFQKYTAEESNAALLSDIATAIKTRQWPHGLNIEKMRVPRFTILSARLDLKARILFTLLPKSAEGEATLLFLDYLPNHDYVRSVFLDQSYLRSFFSTDRLIEVQPVGVDSDVLNADDAVFTSLGDEDAKDFVVELYARPMIKLSDEQKEALTLTLPAVISGVPGSGKTSVLELFLQQQDREEKMLYITKSPQLVKVARAAMSDLSLEYIDIMTVDELYEQCGKSLSALEMDKNALACAAASKTGLSPNTIVKEFPLLAVLDLDVATYCALGQRQTAIPKEKREDVFSCYEAFKRYERGNANLFSGSLTLPEGLSPWSLIVVDEAQDLNVKILVDLFNLAPAGRIVFAYDPHQNISTDLSGQIDNLTLLGTYIYNKQGQGLDKHILSKTYRCPPAIAAQASLVRDVIGQIVHKHKWNTKDIIYRVESIQIEERLPVCWIHAKPKERRFLQAITSLKESASVQWAVITPEPLKGEAEKLFEGPVFSIHEIKGLEYKHIIMYKMMDDVVYAGIASALDDSKKTGNLEESTFHQKMNCLFTAMTRSMESLWIIEKKEHAKEDLFQALGQANALQHTPRLSLQASTQEEIFVEVDRLLSNGNIEQARLLYERHGLQDLGQTFATYFMSCQQVDKEYSSIALELPASEKTIRLPKSGKEQVKAIPKTQEEDLVSADRGEEDKKVQKELLANKCSRGCLEKNLSDKSAFLRILTMPYGENTCIAQLIVQSEKTQLLEHFVSFCCDPRYQERVHLDLFDLAVDGKTFLDYLAVSESGQTLITAFFDKIDNAALLATLKLLQQNGSVAIATNLMKKISRTSKSLKGTEAYITFSNKKEGLFEQVNENLPTKANQKRKDTHSTILPQNSKFLLVSDSEAKTALFFAAQNGHAEIVKILLDAGVNIDIATKDGVTPLFSAAKNGHIEIVKLLIAAGANINLADSKGKTPLHEAAANGRIESVRLLLEARANINIATKNGVTPLFSADKNGHTEIVRLLLDAGATVNLANDQEKTPLSWAVLRGHTEIVRVLVGAGDDINLANENGVTPLSWAAEKGHTEMGKVLVGAGADVNLVDSLGDTPLSWAASRSHTEIVKLLLNAPDIDINFTNRNGNAPLIFAASRDHTEIVSLLLKAPGIDVNLTNKNGDTPLIFAASRGHIEILRSLLSAPGIDVNLANGNGYTPLIFAASRGHTEIVRSLLSAPGINVNLANGHGVTPLIFAALKGHVEIVGVLVGAGADINLANKDGVAPLIFAASHGHTEIVRLLKEEISSQKGLRASLYGMRANDKESCERLARLQTIDLDNEENSDHQLLFHMAKRGFIQALDFLMARSMPDPQARPYNFPGDDINRLDEEGHTVLYHAVQQGQTDMVKHILNKYKPDLTINGNDYDSLLALAAPAIQLHLIAYKDKPSLWSTALLLFSAIIGKNNGNPFNNHPGNQKF